MLIVVSSFFFSFSKQILQKRLRLVFFLKTFSKAHLQTMSGYWFWSPSAVPIPENILIKLKCFWFLFSFLIRPIMLGMLWQRIFTADCFVGLLPESMKALRYGSSNCNKIAMVADKMNDHLFLHIGNMYVTWYFFLTYSTFYLSVLLPSIIKHENIFFHRHSPK